MLTGPQLQAYFERIGLPEVFERHSSKKLFINLGLLQKIMLHHVTRIPFENMDMHNVLLNPTQVPTKVALDEIFEKIVRNKRGGYCFETNELLRQVLLCLGFEVNTYLARVMWLKDKKTYPYHQILLVKLGDQEYLVEPGFGTPGPVEPLLFRDKGQLCAQTQAFAMHDIKRFRFIIDEEGEFQFQSAAPTPFVWHPESEFKPLYSFTAQKLATQEELVQSNYMVSVSAESPFLARLFVTQAMMLKDGCTGRKTLTDKMFKISSPDGVKSTEVETQAQFFEILDKEFGICLPDGSSLTARQIVFADKEPLLATLQALLSSPAREIKVTELQSALPFTPAYAKAPPEEGSQPVAIAQVQPQMGEHSAKKAANF